MTLSKPISFVVDDDDGDTMEFQIHQRGSPQCDECRVEPAAVRTAGTEDDLCDGCFGDWREWAMRCGYRIPTLDEIRREAGWDI